jgi:hypothetical protein
MLFVPAAEAVDVFDDVIEGVPVFVVIIVLVNADEVDDDAEPLGVLDIPPDLVSELNEVGVLELL